MHSIIIRSCKAKQTGLNRKEKIKSNLTKNENTLKKKYQKMESHLWLCKYRINLWFVRWAKTKILLENVNEEKWKNAIEQFSCQKDETLARLVDIVCVQCGICWNRCHGMSLECWMWDL